MVLFSRTNGATQQPSHKPSQHDAKGAQSVIPHKSIPLDEDNKSTSSDWVYVDELEDHELEALTKKNEKQLLGNDVLELSSSRNCEELEENLDCNVDCPEFKEKESEYPSDKTETFGTDSTIRTTVTTDNLSAEPIDLPYNNDVPLVNEAQEDTSFNTAAAGMEAELLEPATQIATAKQADSKREDFDENPKRKKFKKKSSSVKFASSSCSSKKNSSIKQAQLKAEVTTNPCRNCSVTMKELEAIKEDVIELKKRFDKKLSSNTPAASEYKNTVKTVADTLQWVGKAFQQVAEFVVSNFEEGRIQEKSRHLKKTYENSSTQTVESSVRNKFTTATPQDEHKTTPEKSPFNPVVWKGLNPLIHYPPSYNIILNHRKELALEKGGRFHLKEIQSGSRAKRSELATSIGGVDSIAYTSDQDKDDGMKGLGWVKNNFPNVWEFDALSQGTRSNTDSCLPAKIPLAEESPLTQPVAELQLLQETNNEPEMELESVIHIDSVHNDRIEVASQSAEYELTDHKEDYMKSRAASEGGHEAFECATKKEVAPRRKATAGKILFPDFLRQYSHKHRTARLSKRRDYLLESKTSTAADVENDSTAIRAFLLDKKNLTSTNYIEGLFNPSFMESTYSSQVDPEILNATAVQFYRKHFLISFANDLPAVLNKPFAFNHSYSLGELQLKGDKALTDDTFAKLMQHSTTFNGSIETDSLNLFRLPSCLEQSSNAMACVVSNDVLGVEGHSDCNRMGIVTKFSAFSSDCTSQGKIDRDFERADSSLIWGGKLPTFIELDVMPMQEPRSTVSASYRAVDDSLHSVGI